MKLARGSPRVKQIIICTYYLQQQLYFIFFQSSQWLTYNILISVSTLVIYNTESFFNLNIYIYFYLTF